MLGDGRIGGEPPRGLALLPALPRLIGRCYRRLLVAPPPPIAPPARIITPRSSPWQ